MNRLYETAVAGVAVLLLMSTGCRVEKMQHGDGKDVKIDTPFGGMSVTTDGKEVQTQVGLDVYPGAVPEKKDKGDNHAADVTMNFGSFHLGVKAASYTTADAPEKVMAFYRGQMARYGTVIECREGQAVGTPAVTSAGLTCSEDSHPKVHVNSGDNNLELKAGSKMHQHIVGFEPKGSGTKFGLVMLDLPGNLNLSDDEKGDKQ